MNETLEQIGEREILNRLKGFMPVGQTDDDTAQINPYGKHLIINTDLLVEEIHFSDKSMSPEDVGWKAVTANFSDLACSGSHEIIGITVGLVAPPNTSWQWVQEVYKGITNALQEFGGTLLGGDCSSGKQKLLGITALGTLGPLRLHRSYAKPGDSLVVSGPHGLSRLGLALLFKEQFIQEAPLSSTLKHEARIAHQRPKPPIQALKALEKCKPNELPWRAAGTDSSDGLLEAINGICKSSNCQAIVSRANLPRQRNWPLGNPWDDWCINGGEDYELVISLPPKWAQAWLEIMPNSKVIGCMVNGPPEVIWNDNQQPIQSSIGFKHF